MANITVTGGCGYVGSILVPKLLEAGHHVDVVDVMWFGNYLSPHPRLKIWKTDFRDEYVPLNHTVIHLAGVANDPHGELDPKITWELNALGTMQLADRCARAGVAQFIYASSGSVYGVSDAPEVTEDALLDPISEYNKTKMVAERCVLSYAPRMNIAVVRPGTVCGYSPRMRLDVIVNRFTMQALESGRIRIKGGSQMRPHIHIQDMANLYHWLVENPKYSGVVFNAGFENISVRNIAEMIVGATRASFTIENSDDPRSYRLNSDRLLSAGFQPKFTVADAIDEMIGKYRAGELKNEPEWYNLETMNRQGRRAA